MAVPSPSPAARDCERCGLPILGEAYTVRVDRGEFLLVEHEFQICRPCYLSMTHWMHRRKAAPTRTDPPDDPTPPAVDRERDHDRDRDRVRERRHRRRHRRRFGGWFRGEGRRGWFTTFQIVTVVLIVAASLVGLVLMIVLMAEVSRPRL